MASLSTVIKRLVVFIHVEFLLRMFYLRVFFFQDALPGTDSDYALVDDALPQGKIHRIKSTSRKEEKGVTGEKSQSLIGTNVIKATALCVTVV